MTGVVIGIIAAAVLVVVFAAFVTIMDSENGKNF
jgi:hypothetical protein